MTYETCRVCDGDPIEWSERTIDSLPFCERHEDRLRDALRETRDRASYESRFGTWTGTGHYDEDGYEFVVCSRTREHSDAGRPDGALCRYCVALWADEVRYSRTLVLAPLEVDPDDIRYAHAVKVRVDRLRLALESGVISEAEALAMFDKMARPLRGVA
jgi:hypothetical protein